MVAPLPPLDAYRRDLARLGEGRTFGQHDGRWVTAAIVLQRYVESPMSDRAPLATELARQLAIKENTSFWRAGLDLVEDIEEGGALQLAYAVAALQERLVSQDRVLELGRILAYRARLARKLGSPEAARELYDEVAHLGETSAEPELTARAWIGFGVISAERGNLPDARRWFEAAALVADDTVCAEQASLAHQGLMMVLGTAHNFEGALIEGGHAYRWAKGNAIREAEILANLGQLLHDIGHHASSIRCLAAVVTRTERARVLLGAMGTLAMAAAALGRRGVVRAAAERIDRLVAGAWSYPTARALLDASDAFAAVNEPARASHYRQRALDIATRDSLHEIAYRAGEAAPPVAAAPRIELGCAATEVLGDVESLDAPADLCAIG